MAPIDRGGVLLRPDEVEGRGELGAGKLRKLSEVATANWPPPAPRRAQKRSGSRCSLASTMRPSARTTRAPSSWSAVRPCERPRMPSPPPSVRPAMPTSGPQPAAIVRPCGRARRRRRRAVRRRRSWRPRGRARPRSWGDVDHEPSVDERPAKQWPPLRSAAGSPPRGRARAPRRRRLRVWQRTHRARLDVMEARDRGLARLLVTGAARQEQSPRNAAASLPASRSRAGRGTDREDRRPAGPRAPRHA